MIAGRILHGQFDNTGACNCAHGTAYIDPDTGNCMCLNNGGNFEPGSTFTPPVSTVTGVPLKPTQVLPAGFEWTYNAAARRWIPTRIVVNTNTDVSDFSFDSITNWIQEHKVLSLAVAAGGLYLLTKKQ